MRSERRALAMLAVMAAAATSAAAAPSRADWIGTLLPVLGNSTLLDLSLPGTHDSLTFDLSTSVADDANDVPPAIAWILHNFNNVLDVGKAIRNQSMTQGLNLTAQMEGGVRFLDFRITYTDPPNKDSKTEYDWWGLHFMQTNAKALTYLEQVKDFLLAHPSEVVVVWVSRHGNECGTQYPGAKTAQKQAWWASVEALFDGLMFDSRVSRTNETSVAQLVARNHRAVFYVSDGASSANFTNSSPHHLNGCGKIKNTLTPDVSSTPHMLNVVRSKFATADSVMAAAAAEDEFYLLSLAAGAPGNQIVDSFLLDYLPIDRRNIARNCSLAYHVPNMTTWCPMHLQDDGLLTNYYSQVVMEEVIGNTSKRFPNAIYLDGLDVDGTIRVGPDTFGQFLTPDPLNADRPHATAKYGYADALIYTNARRACSVPSPPAACATVMPQVKTWLAQYPATVWDDQDRGRSSTWPADCNGQFVNATSC